MDVQAASRCSDAEREVVAEKLRRHAVAGRFDATELGERLDQALQARTRRELSAAPRHLPTSSHECPSAAIPPATATVVVIAALAIALWLTGHLATDAVMWAVAAAILIVIWRRPRRAS